MFMDATPAKWKVFRVIWVPGSPILWAHKAPTAVPGSITAADLKKCYSFKVGFRARLEISFTFHIFLFAHVDELDELAHGKPCQLFLHFGHFLLLLLWFATAFVVNGHPVGKGLHEVRQFLQDEDEKLFLVQYLLRGHHQLFTCLNSLLGPSNDSISSFVDCMMVSESMGSSLGWFETARVCSRTRRKSTGLSLPSIIIGSRPSPPYSN